MTVAILGSNYRWPSRIRFKFDSNLTDSMRSKILDAIAVYERLTQARFSTDNSVSGAFITFRRDEEILGCGNSHTGFTGSELLLRLKESASRGVVMHELGHALGLFHEHQRPDREDFVHVCTENIDGGAEAFRNFVPKDRDEVVIHGSSYDYDSIMHYPKTAFSDDGDVTIESDHPIGQRDHLSVLDLATIRRLMPSNAHVHRINGDGSIGTEVTRYDWTEGWTVVRFFRLGTTDYLFTLKTSDGTMHINRMEGDGTVGPRVDTRNWTGGWTLVEFFRNGFDTFIFTLKKDTGEAHINKVNGDGTIGTRVETHDWGSGWTAACFYNVLGTDYALFFKRSSGLVHVNKMTWGRVGERITTENLPGGSWRTAVHFSQWTNNFIFFLKDSGAQVSEITWQGKLGRVIKEYSGWTTGWTHAVIYDKNGKKHLLTLKEGSGTVHVNPLNDDGKLSARSDEHDWTGGWNNIAVMDNRYVIVVKETGRAGMI